jgi:MOSC domain-containing protein YiiM
VVVSRARVVGLYAGGVAPLPPEGRPSGIVKKRLDGPAMLGREGLEGDAQADRRVHGGPEKALHHYAAESYAALAAVFPGIAAQLVPGSVGENLTTEGWSEALVCIGDVFRLGEARIQVSQPRSPCWKIDHRYGEPALSRAIAERGLTGWYYRVLEPGRVGPDSEFELLDRGASAVTIRRLWTANLARRPDPDELALLAAAPGLNPGWAKKLADRLDWLRRNPELDLR